MRKKTAGLVLAVTGAVLIASALLLFLHNRLEDRRAGELAQAVLEEMRQLETGGGDAAQPTDARPAPTSPPEETQPPEMPTVQIDGYDYIGTLSVPALELELPVMAEWDYERLRIAPCRELGSTRTDDLVIAAHNYDSHFGRLHTLSAGDTVLFTDPEGNRISYVVVEVWTAAPDAVEAVQNSGHALTLYTCTPGGATRVVVFCDRAPADEKSAPKK